MDKDNQVEAQSPSATRETSGAMAAAREIRDLGCCSKHDETEVAAIITKHTRAESAVPVDESRLAEIKLLVKQNSGPAFGYTHKLQEAVEYLLSCVNRTMGGQ